MSYGKDEIDPELMGDEDARNETEAMHMVADACADAVKKIREAKLGTILMHEELQDLLNAILDNQPAYLHWQEAIRNARSCGL